MNLLKNKNKNLGDGIDYGQKNGNNVGDLITQTLELMEKHGGEDAFLRAQGVGHGAGDVFAGRSVLKRGLVGVAIGLGVVGHGWRGNVPFLAARGQEG